MLRPEDRLRHASHELASSRPVVRAVIVKTWGSTPREVGADMLLDAAGGLQGTVGGGCGEAEVFELAQEMLASPDASKGYLYHVDLTESPEQGGEKVCGGRFDVLLHRLDSPEEARTLQDAMSSLDKGMPLLLKTFWGDAAPGLWKSSKDSSWPLQPRLELEYSGQATLAHHLEEPSGEHSLIEPMGSALRLVIVGAGHIARPLSKLAAEVGYQVVVLDDRPEYAVSEFFPEAHQVVVGDYERELPALVEQAMTSVVLVTRGHKHDQDCLRLVAELPLLYLGMIGSQRRVEAVYADLIAEGISLEALRDVHAPIGLEIGARTPAEIAVSILAQMIMRRRLPDRSSRSSIDRKRRQRSLL